MKEKELIKAVLACDEIEKELSLKVISSSLHDIRFRDGSNEEYYTARVGIYEMEIRDKKVKEAIKKTIKKLLQIEEEEKNKERNRRFYQELSKIKDTPKEKGILSTIKNDKTEGKVSMA